MSKTTLTVLAALLAGYLATLFYWLNHPLASDFTKFYASGIQWQEGGSPYTPLDSLRYDPSFGEGGAPAAVHPNLNPPFVILLMLPFSWLPWSVASLLFSTLSLLAGGLAILLLARQMELPENSETRARCLILLLLFYPTWASVRFGQLSLILFLLLMIFWRELRRQRGTSAGIVLGVLLSLKLFAGLLLLPLLVRRRFRVAAVGLLSGTAGWLLGSLLLGPGVVPEYRRALTQITWTGASWNASLQGFFSRIFGGSEGVPLWPDPLIGRVVATLLAILATLALIVTAGRRLSDDRQMDLSIALTLPLMLLLSPLGWMYYFPILLPAAAILWQRRARLATLGFLALATVPLPFIEAGAINGPLDWFFYSGIYFYALCWLTLALYRAGRVLPE